MGFTVFYLQLFSGGRIDRLLSKFQRANQVLFTSAGRERLQKSNHSSSVGFLSNEERSQRPATFDL